MQGCALQDSRIYPSNLYDPQISKTVVTFCKTTFYVHLFCPFFNTETGNTKKYQYNKTGNTYCKHRYITHNSFCRQLKTHFLSVCNYTFVFTSLLITVKNWSASVEQFRSKFTPRYHYYSTKDRDDKDQITSTVRTSHTYKEFPDI